MFRISKKASVSVSLVLTGLFLAVLIACLFILPGFVRHIRSLSLRAVMTGDAVLITAVGYCVVLFAMLADYLLFRLLLLVRAGEVFTARAVSLIRGVSWCAIAISLLFLLATPYFLIALALAFTAALLGLCLRVVKNVIEEATAIKAENDLTELSEKVGITLANLSILKNNKAKAVRFSTLDAICRALDCKVEDILEYKEGE